MSKTTTENSEGYRQKEEAAEIIDLLFNETTFHSHNSLPIIAPKPTFSYSALGFTKWAWPLKDSGASHILWIRTVTRQSSGMFVAAILVDEMCAENREPGDIKAEVTGHFELAFNSLKDQTYPSTTEVPMSFLSRFLPGFTAW